MNLFDNIERAAANAALIGHKLTRVAISYPLGTDRAALKLGWKGHIGFEPLPSPVKGVTHKVYSPPADTITAICRPSEAEIIATAWRLGAPDLGRIEVRPLKPGQNPRELRYGIVPAFGNYLFSVATAEADALVEAAGTAGWVMYRFARPLAWCGGIEMRTDDGTLDPDGYRSDPPPAWARPVPLGIADGFDARENIWEFSRSACGDLITLDEWRKRYGSQ